MPDSKDKVPESSPEHGGASPELEKRIEATRLKLLDEVLNFARHDNGINEQIARLLKTTVDFAERKPDAFFSGGGTGNIEALIKGLRDLPSDGSIKGGDIVGGLDLSWLKELLEAIGPILDGEKKFWFKILFMIICHRTACDCLCKCACSDDD